MTGPEVPGQQPEDPPDSLPPAPSSPPDFSKPPTPSEPAADQAFPPPPPPPSGGAYPPPPPAGMPPAPAGYGYGQVGAPPPGLVVEPKSGLLLPAGTELASVGRRVGAFFLAIPLSIITLGIGYVIWGLIAWTKGTTPALQVLGMRVYRPDDRKLAGFGYMALREIVGRIVDGILSIITEVISFVLMATRPDRRSLHDLIAGTVVIYDPNKVTAPK